MRQLTALCFRLRRDGTGMAGQWRGSMIKITSLKKIAREVQLRVDHMDRLLNRLEESTHHVLAMIQDRPDVGFLSTENGGVEVAHLQGSSMLLRSSRTVKIPPLCSAVIPHDVSIMTDRTVILIPEPDIMLALGLVIGVQVQGNGEVCTSAFNLTSGIVSVRKGMAVSRLVAL